MYNPYSLKDKTILVTGASSGIGRATAIECSRMGAVCWLTGRNEERLKETFSMLDKNDHHYIVADISTQEGIDMLVNTLPPVDGVVCNAGINKTSPIYFLKQGELEEVLTINITSPMMLIRTMAMQRRLKAYASLVFTSSIDAVTPAITTAAYGASKAALTNFMKVCAKELAPRKIRSNAVHPGMTETPILSEMRMSDEEINQDKQQYLLKRYGRPEEIAWSIVYLLSDASAWVTGSVLTIDGGYSIR